jgi:MFS family permease
VSSVLVALRLPWLGALLLGAIADRSDRRRMALQVAVAQGALFVLTGIALAAGAHSMVFLYIVALAVGTLEVSFMAATSAVVPDLVPTADLVSANGTVDAVRTAGEEFAGQAVGAVLFVTFASLPFFLDGASFVAAAGILFFVLPAHVVRARSRLAGAAAQTTLRQDVLAGARYLWRRTDLRLLAATGCALAFFQSMVVSILVVFALGPLHLAASSYGVFLAVAAIGSFAGGLAAGAVDRRMGHGRSLILAAGLATVAYLILAPAPSFVIAGGALFIEGFAVALGNAASLSIRQERIPRDHLGRINSAFRMFLYGAMPVGAITGGLVSQVWSLRGAVFAAGLLQGVAILLVTGPLLRTLAEQEIDVRS